MDVVVQGDAGQAPLYENHVYSQDAFNDDNLTNKHMSPMPIQATQSHESLMMRVKDEQDRAAYEELFYIWRPALTQYLVKRLGDRQLAEEAHQETWRCVYTSRHTYDPSRRFSPWLFTIARNQATAAHRKRAKMPQDPIDNLQITDFPSVFLQEIGTRLSEVFTELNRLPEDHQDIILLSAEGLTCDEIAPMLGRSAKTVRNLRAEIRKTLRSALNV